MDILDVERKVFRKLLSNPKTLPANLNKVMPEDFNIESHKLVVRAFTQNGNSVHYAPSKEWFEILLRDVYPHDPAKVASGAAILAQLASEPQDQADLDVLIKELKAHRMTNELSVIINEGADLILRGPGRIEDSYDTLLKKLLALPLSGSMANNVGTLKEVDADIEDRVGMYFKPAKKRFACGPRAFTEATGGFAPGELITLLAPTGGGKSTIMLWWAREMLKAGGNVLYVTIEMSYEETMERYHSMVTGLSANKIRRRGLSDAEIARYNQELIIDSKDPSSHAALRKEFAGILLRADPKPYLDIARKYENRKNRFFVLDIPKNCTPSRLDREIAKISLDAPVHLMVVDYLNIVTPNFHSKDHVREQASIAQDLKALARKMNCIVLTAGQLNTTNMEEGAPVGTDDAKYCRAIGENSDWMPGFYQSPQDKMMKQVRMNLAKARSTAVTTALLEVDFDTMQIRDLGYADQVPQPEPTQRQVAEERRAEYVRMNA